MAQAQQPISDDQELAKVLAGVNQEANENALPAVEPTATALPTPDPAAAPEEPAAVPETDYISTPVTPAPAAPAVTGSSDLDEIKKDALNDLRPLVDKLDVAPEEKFDTYLLLLRSTDDQSLIPQAYESARSIADEARRAQALLDIIKEIDYLSGPKQ